MKVIPLMVAEARYVVSRNGLHYDRRGQECIQVGDGWARIMSWSERHEAGEEVQVLDRTYRVLSEDEFNTYPWNAQQNAWINAETGEQAIRLDSGSWAIPVVDGSHVGEMVVHEGGGN